MSTIFNVRNMKLPGLSKTSVIVGTVIVIVALVAATVGWHLYKKLTTNTVVAYFPQTLALYPGDKVQIMGVRVGTIDTIEPAGDKMKVTFTYASKYKVPANVTANVLNPSLVASRTIQLAPPYTGGPELQDGAVIPIDRTQVPVEYDELRDSINRILTDLGPTPQQPKGPFGDVIESFADGLAGKGKEINTTLNSLSEALTTLNQGRGDFFGVVKSLALFVNALYKSDQQFVALNNDLAQFTSSFTNTDQEVATAVKDLDQLLTTTRGFLNDNASVLTKDVNNLADVTNAILQPEPRDGLETGLHVFPNLGANLMNIASPNAGGIVGLPVINNFANPMQFLCSSIQAGSRLGYQDSAELCAQYLAPILDAIKFNYLPFGLNQVSTADDAAQADRLLRAPPAAPARLQGHHRARHLLARHVVLARQPRTGLDRRARHAGHPGTAVDAEHADAGVVVRVDGWTRHRATARAARVRGQRRTAAGAAGRLQREHPAAAAVVSAAGAASRTGPRRDPRRSAWPPSHPRQGLHRDRHPRLRARHSPLKQERANEPPRETDTCDDGTARRSAGQARLRAGDDRRRADLLRMAGHRERAVARWGRHRGRTR